MNRKENEESRIGKIIDHLRIYRKYFEENGRFTVYPFELSVPGISDAIGLSRQPTYRHLSYLEKLGVLERRFEYAKGHKRKTTVFVLKPSNYK